MSNQDGVCERKTGKCQECVYDIDCQPLYKEPYLVQSFQKCGSKCIYNDTLKKNQCVGGVVVDNCPNCVATLQKDGSSFTYNCANEANTSYEISWGGLIFGILIFILIASI